MLFREKFLPFIFLAVIGGFLFGFALPGSNLSQPQGIVRQVQQVRSSVVHVEKVGVCQGSGVLISNDGLIVTAKHVTDGGGKFIITLDDGSKYETDVVVESKGFDIAFLKITSDKEFPVASLSVLDTVRVGDPVFIMGSPFGREGFNSVSLGIISSDFRDLDAKRDYGYGWKVTFQSTSPAFPGNSGGPVFNMQGQVIGILVAGVDATLNFSVPVRVFVNDLWTVQFLLQQTRFQVMSASVDAMMQAERELKAPMRAKLSPAVEQKAPKPGEEFEICQ